MQLSCLCGTQILSIKWKTKIGSPQFCGFKIYLKSYLLCNLVGWN
uniref:Uncharacterized protein n=1 Tax=Rhizophora mucronata TaxID=61149 RepID=A0A2P2IXG1_RHIMU